MGNFCKYCGKPLVDGTCDCEKSKTAQNAQPNAAAQNVQPNAAAQNAQSNAAAQNVQYQQAIDASKVHLNNSKAMFFDFLKNPMEMMSKVTANQDKMSPLILGILNIVIVILFCIIRIPYLDGSMKFGIGMRIALVLVAIVIATATITFIFSRKYNPTIGYLDVLCVFCLTTIPTSILILAAFFISYVSIPLAALTVVMGLLSWIILCAEAANVCLKVSKDFSFWISIIIIGIVLLIAYAVGKSIVVSMIEDTVGGLLDFGGDFLDML